MFNKLVQNLDAYSIKNINATKNIACAIDYNIVSNNKYIVVCIGSDLVLGDSLGPLVGTFLKNRGLLLPIYGCLGQPVTAKEIAFLGKFIKKIHPNCKVLAIDAGVGEEVEVGSIKVLGHGLKPGLGVNKVLPTIGDISIVGVVAGKSLRNEKLLSQTRLSLIYKMAGVIADGIMSSVLGKNVVNDRFDDLVI
jgi:putative sporulation protein YyaC